MTDVVERVALAIGSMLGESQAEKDARFSSKQCAVLLAIENNRTAMKDSEISANLNFLMLMETQGCGN
jgi:hypothetical protein